MGSPPLRAAISGAARRRTVSWRWADRAMAPYGVFQAPFVGRIAPHRNMNGDYSSSTARVTAKARATTARHAASQTASELPGEANISLSLA